MSNIFRYVITNWDDDEMKPVKCSGFVAAEDYSRAVMELEDIFTDPAGKCSIIDIYCMETDSYDGRGILEDAIIQEIFDEN